MSTTSKYWCFTWNNYTEINEKNLKELKEDKIDYIVFGYEKAPTTGTPHLQGYVEFKNKISCKASKEILDPVLGKLSAVSMRIRKAAKRMPAILYCKKGEQSSEEWAEWKLKRKSDPDCGYGPNHGKNAVFYENSFKELNAGKGKRTDWHEFHSAIKEKSLSELMEHHPEKTIKYWNAVKSIKASIDQHDAKKRIFDSFKDFHFRSWQKFLMKILNEKPDPRRVYWIYDTCGGTGKTEFSRYLSVVHKACFLQNAKTADAAHAWNGEQIVVFNFPKCTMDQINYNAIESIKDATVFSPKYDSGSKIFERPHVVCFANFAPERTKLMDDRWYILHLSEKDQKDDIIVSIEPDKDSPPSMVAIHHQGEVTLSPKEDNIIIDDLEDD